VTTTATTTTTTTTNVGLALQTILEEETEATEEIVVTEATDMGGTEVIEATGAIEAIEAIETTAAPGTITVPIALPLLVAIVVVVVLLTDTTDDIALALVPLTVVDAIGIETVVLREMIKRMTCHCPAVVRKMCRMFRSWFLMISIGKHAQQVSNSSASLTGHLAHILRISKMRSRLEDCAVTFSYYRRASQSKQFFVDRLSRVSSPFCA
jgi:hypothetical protein